jgi:hypothetical protein
MAHRSAALALLVLLLSPIAWAATAKNDDSCDLALLPAATLLLPYFEVDIDDPNGTTTLFTITNATSLDQIAHVTLWTDFAFPVIDFNIYLTGYDVQAINMYDILARGVIAPELGTGTELTKRGKYSDRNTNINLSSCDRLPGWLDNVYVTRMQEAFVHGRVPDLSVIPGCSTAGSEHTNAVGYATIDVVRACTTTLPTEDVYWTNEIGYDNVFVGDYQQVTRKDRFAEGGPMVHIRAVPEGSAGGDAGFPRTFYSRYQPAASPRGDRRQPLPSVFATRWISGGAASFGTSLKIWREGKTGRGSACADFANEARLEAREVVVFDEAENAVSGLPSCRCGPYDPSPYIFLPTSMTDIHDDEVYPQMYNAATAGWAYLNLHTPGQDGYATQAWVITSMRAEGQFSVDMDAVGFGNGCSPPAAQSEIGVGSATIGPRP